MSKPVKFSLALSCFLPLFLVFGAENLCAAICAFSTVENKDLLPLLKGQSNIFWVNASMLAVWLLLLVTSVIGILRFQSSFLKAKRLSKETVILKKAENITADYYFTYFSLFVISFFGVDPTNLKDILIFGFLLILIIWVYIANEMYFVNPVLNILGYKSFSILYEKTLPPINNGEKATSFEIKVFSRDPLNRMIEEKLFVTFSPHDFSVCYPMGKKNDN